MKMKKCELCGGKARMYCESDRASICWDCDEKVHGANFLVAKHPRVLLCHVCYCKTPWTSCGAKLTPTVSVCQSCVGSRSKMIEMNEKHESEAENDDDDDDDDDDGDDDDDEGDDEVEDEDENQVVPWSCCSYSPAQPPPTASGSDSEAEVSASTKRRRENDELGCDHFDGSKASFGGSLRPLKRPRLGDEERNSGDGDDAGESKWRATAIVSSIQSLENQMIRGGGHASAAVLRICKLSRDEYRNTHT